MKAHGGTRSVSVVIDAAIPGVVDEAIVSILRLSGGVVAEERGIESRTGTKILAEHRFRNFELVAPEDEIEDLLGIRVL